MNLAGKIVGMLIICLIFSGKMAYAQNNAIAVSAGFMQLKEGFNQGIVFNGLQINAQYQHYWGFSTVELSYNPKLALGSLFSRGMIAIDIHFVPVDISCLKSIFKTNKHSIKGGINFASNYSYQEYPDLHSAHLFWFGEIGFSPRFEYQYKWSTSSIKLSLQNSLFGFVSHTTTNDTYFYSFKVMDFFSRPHENMKFGSFDKYNHSNFQIEYMPNTSKKHIWGVGAEYTNYFSGVHFQSLNYSLQWKKLF
jgi:hypothetical protein